MAPMPMVLGVAGIDDAVFLHLGDREGDLLVGHVRIVLLDRLVGGRVVAVEIVVPALDRAIDEALGPPPAAFSIVSCIASIVVE